MARGRKKVEEVEVEIEEQEVVADGVVRDADAENPIEDNPVERKPRKDGNWIKVTHEEMAALELSGKLIGYDKASGEALIK
jgi:hypothetical protein